MPAYNRASPILFDLELPIETERLHIRAIAFGDGAAKAEAVAESWDDLDRWLTWTQVHTRAELTDPLFQEEQIRRAIADMILRNTIRLLAIEKETGKPAVYFGFHKLDWVARQFELDFWTSKALRNRGYATEACRAAIDWAFRQLQATVINVTHTKGNATSEKVIKKLGFKFTHILPYSAPLTDGMLHDNYKYSLSLDDWPNL